jgi:hypothetical protein
VITNNVKEFRPLAGERLAQGGTHPGLILLPSKRTRTRASVAAIARAIEQVLHDPPDGLSASELWIGPLRKPDGRLPSNDLPIRAHPNRKHSAHHDRTIHGD